MVTINVSQDTLMAAIAVMDYHECDANCGETEVGCVWSALMELEMIQRKLFRSGLWNDQ